MLLHGDMRLHTTRSGREFSKYGDFSKYRKAGGGKPTRSSLVPTPILVQGELLWEVEKVVKSRVGRFGREYWVKWKGFSTGKNSWISDLPPYFQKVKKVSQKRALDYDSESSSGSSESESDSSDSDSDSEPDEAFTSAMKRFAQAEEPIASGKLDERTQLAVNAMLALSTAVMHYADDTESDSD
jgi:hypothetical protein